MASTPTASSARKSTAVYASASSSANVFTPEMRDRQARGKNPYSKPDTSDSDCEEDEDGEAPAARRRVRLGRSVKAESFEDRERRGFALSVLDSPEQLMMYAQSAGDSIPGQRLRFTAMLCGFDSSRDGKRPSATGAAGKRRVSGMGGR